MPHFLSKVNSIGVSLDFEQKAAEVTEKFFSVLSGFLLFKFMNNSG
jgi:hypothetical protein